ncbi:hypothetical protein JB92DRAFT_2699590, partial [Gautieria morchelliformis]
LKVISVGQNPTDYKHVDLYSKPGDWVGCDFVGEVVQLGDDVPEDQVMMGEVSCDIIYLLSPTHQFSSDFNRFVTTEWDLSSVVPQNITPQQAASLPIPILTAVQALYLPSRLGLPEPPAQEPSKAWILIWSGGTAVGSYAIQLAKLTGLRVATTASPRHWAQLESYGADLIVDYKDQNVVGKLKKDTGNSIRYGLDCVSGGDSYNQAQDAFHPEGGTLVMLLPPTEDLPRSKVKTTVTMIYTALGEDAPWGSLVFKADPSDRQLIVRWNKKLTALLAEEKIKVPLLIVLYSYLRTTF